MGPAVGFVGRERELAALCRALDGGLGGNVSLTFVVGEAGMGKTTLVERVAVDARKRGMRVLWGNADDADGTGLWRDVRAALAIADERGDSGLPPAERRWEHLVELADAIASATPILVVLEDVHAADETSMWILERLPRELAGRQVAFLATSREGGRPARAGAVRTDVIELAGFDPLEIDELLGVLRGAAGLDAGELHERTGGNPLFVREVVRLGPTAGLPPIAGEVLERSLDRLAEPVRRALATLAAAGSDAPRSIVAMTTGCSPTELRDVLDEAVRAGILVEAADGQVRFRHALLSEAAFGARPAGERRGIHAALAEAWTSSGDHRPLAWAATARHRLIAVPLEDPVTAGEAALQASVRLTASGEVGLAAALLHLAGGVVEANIAEPRLLARILVQLGEVRFLLGDVVQAGDAFERAALLAGGLGDGELLATAEVGAARHLPFFVMDPARQRRLAAAEVGLPPGDQPLRVQLLGRLAVLGRADPDASPGLRRLGDEAVAMARRLGDGDLIASALADRYFAAGGIEDLDARHHASDELIALGEQRRRPDLAMLGQEWSFAARLYEGDLDGARDSLARLEAMAQVMPSAAWRYAALLRRVVLHNLDGDHQAALDVIAEATHVGSAVNPDAEVRGLEYNARLVVARLWGRADPALNGLHAQTMEALGTSPSPFIQIPLAASSLVVGDAERARTITARFVRRLDQVASGLEGMPMICWLGAILADVGVDVDTVSAAAEIHSRLARCAGKLLVGNGLGLDLPVDTVRGRLALAAGRPDDALDDLERGASFARRTTSAPLLARCLQHLAVGMRAAGAEGAEAVAADAAHLADHLGLELTTGGAAIEPPRREPAPVPVEVPLGERSDLVVWRRDGDRWSITSSHESGVVPHSAGVEQLLRLVTAPGSEVPATELAWGTDAPARPSDAGPALDGQAKRAYRARLLDLQAEIDEAEAFADLERSTRARLELDALMGELRRAVGLGGRDRPNASAAERARINVTRSLRRAIATVGDAMPALGAHLAVSVNTGRYCSYRPEPTAARRWELHG